MECEIPDTKCKEIHCEVCRHNIKKLGWAKHLKTKKHIENEKGVEEVEKKQCRKCGCWRVLELYRGENATCNVCLGYRESWAGKNPEKVRDMNRNYWAEHREEKKVYNKEYSQREIECEVCECRVRKCNWARHLGTRKHMLGGGGGKVDGDGGVGEDDTKGKHSPFTTTTISISSSSSSSGSGSGSLVLRGVSYMAENMPRIVYDITHAANLIMYIPWGILLFGSTYRVFFVLRRFRVLQK